MTIQDMFARLDVLTQFMNTVRVNAKKIIDLPVSTVGDKKVAVWNSTSNATEQFDLSAALDDVFTLTDRVITEGDITRVDDTFTYETTPQPFTWRISGVIYTGVETDITIDTESSGNKRIDIVVADNVGVIRKIVGFASTTVATPPEVEPGTLLLRTYYIDEDTVSGGSALNIKVIRKWPGNSGGMDLNEANDYCGGWATTTVDNDTWNEGVYTGAGDSQDWAYYTVLVSNGFTPV